MKKYPELGNQKKLKAWVNTEKCMGCGLCVIKCPDEAITMRQISENISIADSPAISSGTYGVQSQQQAGKHIDTGSVMLRPRP